jgi:hypothetical protein
MLGNTQNTTCCVANHILLFVVDGGVDDDVDVDVGIAVVAVLSAGFGLGCFFLLLALAFFAASSAACLSRDSSKANKSLSIAESESLHPNASDTVVESVDGSAAPLAHPSSAVPQSSLVSNAAASITTAASELGVGVSRDVVAVSVLGGVVPTACERTTCHLWRGAISSESALPFDSVQQHTNRSMLSNT